MVCDGSTDATNDNKFVTKYLFKPPSIAQKFLTTRNNATFSGASCYRWSGMLEPHTDESGCPMPHGYRAEDFDEAAPLTDSLLAAQPSMDWAQLAQLATHLGQVPSALWMQALPSGPVVLGACGLPPDQQAAALARCGGVLAGRRRSLQRVG